jgi:hypothetical protein
LSLLALSLLETLTLPSRIYTLPNEVTRADWVTWLKQQPSGAAVMVPFAQGGAASDFEPTAIAMLQSLEHGHPLANGYSGLFPSAHSRLRAAMERFPNARSLTLLRRAGVSYVIIERSWLTPMRERRLATSGLRQAFAGAEKVVYVDE